MVESAITSKGQTTLPKPVRTALGVGEGDRVRYVILEDEVRIRRVRGMIALDTNVLIRFLVDDEPRQARTAREFLEQLTGEYPGFVCREVIVELVWVLERACGFSRERIAGVLDALIGICRRGDQAPAPLRSGQPRLPALGDLCASLPGCPGLEQPDTGRVLRRYGDRAWLRMDYSRPGFRALRGFSLAPPSAQ